MATIETFLQKLLQEADEAESYSDKREAYWLRLAANVIEQISIAGDSLADALRLSERELVKLQHSVEDDNKLTEYIESHIAIVAWNNAQHIINNEQEM